MCDRRRCRRLAVCRSRIRRGRARDCHPNSRALVIIVILSYIDVRSSPFWHNRDNEATISRLVLTRVESASCFQTLAGILERFYFIRRLRYIDVFPRATFEISLARGRSILQER